MTATIICLPTAADAPVPVWKRCNQNWPRGVVVLADERRARSGAEKPELRKLTDQELVERYQAAHPDMQNAIAWILDSETAKIGAPR